MAPFIPLTHPPTHSSSYSTVARRRPGHPQELPAVAYGCSGRQPVPNLHPRTGRSDREARPHPLLKSNKSHTSPLPFSPYAQVCGEPRLGGQRGGQVPPTTGQGLRADAQELGPAKGTMGKEGDWGQPRSHTTYTPTLFFLSGHCHGAERRTCAATGACQDGGGPVWVECAGCAFSGRD